MILKFTQVPPPQAPRDTPSTDLCIDHADILAWNGGGQTLREKPCSIIFAKGMGLSFLVAESMSQITPLMLKARMSSPRGLTTMILKFTQVPPPQAPRDTPSTDLCIDHADILAWNGGGQTLREKPCSIIFAKGMGLSFLVAESMSQITPLMLKARMSSPREKKNQLEPLTAEPMPAAEPKTLVTVQ